MAEINQFCSDPITCYAQSGTSERLALSPNNNLVYIYKQQNSTWVEESILSQHDLRVTSIDWAPKTDRIVTCSADRNAYVWTSQEDGTWKPTLVLLRINRAATCVKWSPNEDKFAVGTAAKLVCICYFESANDWWASKHIKKPIKSTVTCIDWHPNSILLACGSTDYKSRIFSTFIKEVDQKQIQSQQQQKEMKSCSWLRNRSDLHDAINDNTNTGILISEFSNSGAWVHDVAFSPDGQKLAWVSHDSSLSVVDSTQSMTVVTLKTRYLPFLSCVWVSVNSLVAAGHDCCPMLFNYQSSGTSTTTINNTTTTALANGTQRPILKFVGRLDRSQKKEADGQSAMRKFRDLDAKADNHHNIGGTSSMAGGDSCLGTIHQNTIAQIRLCSKSKSVATVGLDGKLVVWSLDPSIL